MSIGLSAYLNILRLAAALLVYIYHYSHFAKLNIPLIGDLGSEAVIIFFVLSGFVISYSTTKAKLTAKNYFSARIARLWSVAIPALILTFILDSTGQFLSIESYSPLQPYPPFKWVASLLINLFFLNQLWDLNIWPGSNSPFWSLCYEFWYYVLFSVIYYTRGNHRLLLVSVILFILGPKIALGFPIWIMGLLLYFLLLNYPQTNHTNRGLYGIIWIITLLLGFIYINYEVKHFLHELFPSIASNSRWEVNFFPISYGLGLVVSLNIFAFNNSIFRDKIFFANHEKIIRYFADLSFGLYLFHYPALYFFMAVFNSSNIYSGFFYQAMLLALPLALSFILAHFCEKFKIYLNSKLIRIF